LKYPDEANRKHHIFTNEEDYYEDMSKSWFGLTCVGVVVGMQ
jgi:hypothetical protein